MAWIPDAANAGVTENDVDGIVITTQTIGALVNGILFAWMAWSTTTTIVSGVMCNGAPMTKAVSFGTNRGVALYFLVNPSAGLNTITWTGSAVFGRACAGSHSWSGAHSTQTPTTITGGGTSATPSVTVVTAVDELIVDVLGISFTSGDTLTKGADQIEQGKITGGATTGASSTQDGVSGGVMSWTDSNSRAYGYAAASFDPAPNPAPSIDFAGYSGGGLYFEERPRPRDTSKRLNPTRLERQVREDEEILVL